MNRKMTLLALGATCGFLGASDSPGSAAGAAAAASHSPSLVREQASFIVCVSSMDELVQAHESVAEYKREGLTVPFT